MSEITYCDDEYILKSEGITKRFGGVTALDNVDFNLKPGEVHALVGENGAGKSTYIKILCGLYKKDAGSIFYANEEYGCENPIDARKAGIGMVPQILELAETLTVAENIFMGVYPRTVGGLVDWKALRKKAYELSEKFNMQDMIDLPVSELGTGHKQMIEILRSLIFDTKIIAFDEPTASLSDEESKTLFRLIEELKNKGISIIYVSHRLEELFQIADRFTVLKDGKYIATKAVGEVTKNEIVSLMVGRDLDLFGEDLRVNKPVEDCIFEVSNLKWGNKVNNISFQLRKHEILGFFGMVGAGRTETVMATFGAVKKDDGKIFLEGDEISIKSPRDAVKKGMGLVPEDRILEGVILGSSIKNNMSLPFIHKLQSGLFINEKNEKKIVKKFIDALKVKTPDEMTQVYQLSGGNQQKVSIAKWLAAESKVIIFDEPTHGIDVGAKHDIYQLLRKLSDEGRGVIIISSELPEILNVCDRVLVFRDGGIVKEFKTVKGVTEADVVASALG